MGTSVKMRGIKPAARCRNLAVAFRVGGPSAPRDNCPHPASSALGPIRANVTWEHEKVIVGSIALKRFSVLKMN